MTVSQECIYIIGCLKAKAEKMKAEGQFKELTPDEVVQRVIKRYSQEHSETA